MLLHRHQAHAFSTHDNMVRTQHAGTPNSERFPCIGCYFGSFFQLTVLILKLRPICSFTFQIPRLALDKIPHPPEQLMRLSSSHLLPAEIFGRSLAHRSENPPAWIGWDYRTASRRGGVSTKRGGSWMGRPGRAGRGVRLGGGGAGEA